MSTSLFSPPASSRPPLPLAPPRLPSAVRVLASRRACLIRRLRATTRVQRCEHPQITNNRYLRGCASPLITLITLFETHRRSCPSLIPSLRRMTTASAAVSLLLAHVVRSSRPHPHAVAMPHHSPGTLTLFCCRSTPAATLRHRASQTSATLRHRASQTSAIRRLCADSFTALQLRHAASRAPPPMFHRRRACLNSSAQVHIRRRFAHAPLQRSASRSLLSCVAFTGPLCTARHCPVRCIAFSALPRLPAVFVLSTVLRCPASQASSFTAARSSSPIRSAPCPPARVPPFAVHSERTVGSTHCLNPLAPSQLRPAPICPHRWHRAAFSRSPCTPHDNIFPFQLPCSSRR